MTFETTRILCDQMSAADRATAALRLREGCREFVTGQPADIATVCNESTDARRIFPRKWCEDRGIAADRHASIPNRTPLTAASNRMIGRAAPSDDLARIERDRGPTRLDDVLRCHLIDPALLRAVDFNGFPTNREVKPATFAARATAGALAAAVAPDEPEDEAADAEEAA